MPYRGWKQCTWLCYINVQLGKLSQNIDVYLHRYTILKQNECRQMVFLLL